MFKHRVYSFLIELIRIENCFLLQNDFCVKKIVNNSLRKSMRNKYKEDSIVQNREDMSSTTVLLNTIRVGSCRSALTADAFYENNNV